MVKFAFDNSDKYAKKVNYSKHSGVSIYILKMLWLNPLRGYKSAL